jgi:hypothetical protein
VAVGPRGEPGGVGLRVPQDFSRVSQKRSFFQDLENYLSLDSLSVGLLIRFLKWFRNGNFLSTNVTAAVVVVVAIVVK